MGVLLHSSVDDSAARQPDQEAFRYQGEAITYAELAERSNQLANALRATGLETGSRVGVYMLKGLELPVALYGVLKAGAAYVPIDPAAPQQRVQFILENCEVRHLVTNDSRARKAAALAESADVVRHLIGGPEGDAPEGYDTAIPWAEVLRAPTTSPQLRIDEADLAYIMYTSGSTGVPKGLMHTHASGGSYARLSAREYDVRPEDRLGNHSPLHFDMSTFEYLTGPLRGATSVLIPEEVTMFPVELASLIEQERLTFWYSVPLALIQLVDQGGLEDIDLSSLRWILFGGEPFPPKYLQRLTELAPKARFSNSYGPAEVNQCTAYHVPQGPIAVDQPIPIGPVWAEANGLVLDDSDKEVKPGESGELLVDTPTMMRGYWARPDLDREAFWRHPVSGRVFYRTGDLVQDRGDGNLVFLGRRDRQIKVRGNRVELDEVEAVLDALPEVREAAAFDVTDADGQTMIVAVILLRGGQTAQAEALRQAAAQRLPSYALPTRLEVRDTLPRTGTGKIDRRALKESSSLY